MSRQLFSDTHKQCFTCKRLLSREQFSPAPRNRSGLATDCHPCQRKRVARSNQRLASPERTAAAKERRRKRTIESYGITVDQYDAILVAQGGGCICGAKHPGGRWRHFHVDHDHETGEVRGVLCHGCNTAAGLAGEDPARLRLLADYLEARAMWTASTSGDSAQATGHATHHRWEPAITG